MQLAGTLFVTAGIAPANGGSDQGYKLTGVHLSLTEFVSQRHVKLFQFYHWKSIWEKEVYSRISTPEITYTCAFLTVDSFKHSKYSSNSSGKGPGPVNK